MLFSFSGIDIVLNHRLTESGFGSKKDYTVYLKDYMKKIVTYLENNGRADEVDSFKKNINGYMKDVLGRFKDLQFFVGEIILINCKAILEKKTPVQVNPWTTTP